MRLLARPVQEFTIKVKQAFIAIFCLLGGFAAAEDDAPTTTVVISVAEQKLVLLRDGAFLKKYPISTSKFGVGDGFGSYKTPLGKLRVCQKVGDDLSIGAVLKERHATGEVLTPNSPGRDPIVTRILWLEGLEAQNEHARSRGIYIHGTNEESKIGQPVSYGCIRMKSKDVVEVFDAVPLDAQVSIIPEKFPHYAKYTPPKPKVIAATAPAKPAPASPAPTPSPAKKIAAATPVPAVATGPRPTPAAKPTVTPAIASRTTPAPTVAKHPTIAPTPAVETKPEPEVHTPGHFALKGSMLDAGLPDGPKIPTLPNAPEPKDVAHFSPTPGLPTGSAFSLHGITRDLSPADRTAELEALAHEAEASRQCHEAESADPPAPQPTPRVALRATAEHIKPKH